MASVTAFLTFSIRLGVNTLIFCCSWWKIPWVVSPNLPVTRTGVKSSCRYLRCANKHTIRSLISWVGFMSHFVVAWMFVGNFKHVSMYLADVVKVEAVGYVGAFIPVFDPWKHRSPGSLCLDWLLTTAWYSLCKSSIWMCWKPLLLVVTLRSTDGFKAFLASLLLPQKVISFADSHSASSSYAGLEWTMINCGLVPPEMDVSFMT